MLLRNNTTRIYIVACLLLYNIAYSAAQTLQYSRQNVFTNNANSLQMAAGIEGTHHLICCSNNEYVRLVIFNNSMELKKEVTTPVFYAEKTSTSIIPFSKYYYLWMRPRYGRKTFLWRIDGNGNCTDLTPAMQQLLRSQASNMESGFQLYKKDNELLMSYHTYLPKLEKNVLTLLTLDSGLSISHTRKVMYAFKRDEEKLLQETFIPGKDLLVLKKNNSGSAMQLMKVSSINGLAITNEFATSGYYSQGSFLYNNTDSLITVSALLYEPGKTEQKNYVFVSRLNMMLLEQTPFTILKTQFRRKTGTNFLGVDGTNEWLWMRKNVITANNIQPDYRVTVYQDLTMPDSGRLYQLRRDNNMLASFNSRNSYDDPVQLLDVRFSLLSKNLQLSVDTIIRNNRDSYTLRADDFYRFKVNDKPYLLLGQLFRKVKGLLLVQPNEAQQLVCNSLPVIGKYNYILSKAQAVSDKTIVIPYLYRQEAGLIKITIE